MPKAVVTGGAGFIGSHIVEECVRIGYAVTVIDNLSTGNRKNLPASDHVRFVEGDIRDSALLSRELKGADVVSHQAAIASVPATLDDPEGTYDVNVEGTRAVFQAARESGVGCVMYASSCAVYGSPEVTPVREDASLDPQSPYAEHKIAAEEIADEYAKEGALSVVGLRYFNVYGPRQGADSAYAAVIPRFIQTMTHNEEPTINGDGETTRDFVSVHDLVRAHMNAFSTRRAHGEIFNIGSGKESSLNDLVAVINDVLGTSLSAQYNDFREGDVRRSVAAISKAEEILGFQPSVSLKEGIAELIEEYVEKKDIA